MALSPELAEIEAEVQVYAREYGLDFFDTIFELLDYQQINEVAAYDGFPGRYPHWRFGMEYLRMSKSYAYGLHRIYEMVINNTPAYAYLLEGNSLTDQKLVMAHVYAHVDFFKNNMWFARTNRKMMDEMANHGTHIRRYIDRCGYETVEKFLDLGLSLDNLIDPHSPGIRRRVEPAPKLAKDEEDEPGVPPVKLPSKFYMDDYINPPEFLEAQRKKIQEEQEHQKHFPERPERDVLLFLLEHAPLEEWQSDIISIVREEAYYFAPQGQTKIMNEGWASYWHSKIMTERALKPDELIDYADHHAGILASSPGHLNPYKLGLELWRDIEERWDKGRFGSEWEECQDEVARRDWDRQLGLGRQKIFEVRRIYNDVGFIDAFLTPEFARRYNFFTYKYDPKTNEYVIDSRDFSAIKRQLLFSLTNFGQPIVAIQDANHANRGELYLRHQHDGIDLRLDWARDTLANVQAIWSRPVHLETLVKGTPMLFSYDGEKHSEKRL
jgi:stage V sporulation protein R